MMTRPFHFWVVGSLCWGAGGCSSLSYYTRFCRQGNCSVSCFVPASFSWRIWVRAWEASATRQTIREGMGRMKCVCFVLSMAPRYSCNTNVATFMLRTIVDEPRMADVVMNNVATWQMSCVQKTVKTAPLELRIQFICWVSIFCRAPKVSPPESYDERLQNNKRQC